MSHQVPDSASTGTALFTGIKTNSGMLGVSGKAKNNDCDSLFGNELTSILDWAQHAGNDSNLQNKLFFNQLITENKIDFK